MVVVKKSKKPLKSTLSKKKKVGVSTGVELKQAARAHWSFSTKLQLEKFVFSVDVSHSFSASAEAGETDKALNLRVAKEAMRQFKEVYTDALRALKTLKDEAFEDLLDEEE